MPMRVPTPLPVCLSTLKRRTLAFLPTETLGDCRGAGGLRTDKLGGELGVVYLGNNDDLGKENKMGVERKINPKSKCK